MIIEQYEPDENDFRAAQERASLYHSTFSELVMKGVMVEVAQKTAIEAVEKTFNETGYNPPVVLEPSDRPF